MKIFQIRSLPLKDVITELAAAFDTEVENNCGEYTVHIPDNFGTGFVKGINFHSGLGLVEYNCSFFEDLEIQFTVNEVHPAKFMYCAKGSVNHKFQGQVEVSTINQYQNIIVASNQHNGHILVFEKGKEIYLSSLEIDRKQFMPRMECGLDTLCNEIQDVLTDYEGKRQFHYEGFYSLSIADLIVEATNFQPAGFLRTAFLEGKAYEILTYQLLQYQDDLEEDGNRMFLRKSEVEIINKAARMIHENLSTLGTVKEIAQEVGTNVNKLQDGFKRLYGTTVNSFIQNERLSKARDFLLSTDMDVSEIVYKVGLSSRSYFSKIFKEKYGISPKDFKMSNRIDKTSNTLK